jgi:hypothetical protein
VLPPRLLGGIDQRLGLVRHGDRVAGQGAHLTVGGVQS